MAYTAATASDLKTRFPRFAAVADATVEAYLTEALRNVDEAWIEDDYAMGQMLMAAHLMILEGLGTGTEAQVASEGLGDYRSIRSGSLSLDRFDGDNNAAAGTIGSTSYGKRWLELARRNRGGARVVPTGTVPYEGWPNRVWGT